MEEKKSVLEQVAESLVIYNAALSAVGGEETRGIGWLMNLLNTYFAEAGEAQAKGRPLAWINFAVPSEIFWAMDMVPVVVEVVNGLVAPFGPKALEYIDMAEKSIPNYICSSCKVLMGAMLSGDITAPDVLVVPSQPCDSNLAMYSVASKRFDFPYFCIDMPYLRSEQGTEYIAGELKKMVKFLEEKTNRKLDLDKLKQTMEYSNLAHEYYLKLDKLREAVPCPYSSLEILAEYPAILCMAGRPELVDYLKKRYEMTKAKVAKGESGLSSSTEKYRLVWIYGAPAFDLFTFSWLEQEHGAVSVNSMMNNFTMQPVEDISDYDKIMMGLAEKLKLMPMTRECGGPWEQFIDATIELCRRTKADAALFGGHVACKSNWAIMKLVKDKIREELGIPTLILELDVFDPRVTSSDALRAKFDDFFATVLRK